MRKLSDQNKINIVTEYLQGESSLKLGQKYNVSKQAILAILRIRNVEIRGKNGK